ncbi:TM234 protein, partial [Piprites chloris]|nr:TM234 protein [Piprites chloris]
GRGSWEPHPTDAAVPTGQAASLALVAVLWGGSSPFLRAGAAGMEEVRGRGRLGQLLAEIRFLGLNCKVGPGAGITLGSLLPLC